jgi:hypothetical protein
MSIGLLFWVIMVIWFVSWAASTWGAGSYPWAIHASTLLFFILMFLLGWKVFGFVIQGA